MLHEMSSVDFAGWIAYARLEPWGEEAADLRHGYLGMRLAQCMGVKNVAPSDFMVDWDELSRRRAPDSDLKTLNPGDEMLRFLLSRGVKIRVEPRKEKAGARPQG